MEPYYEEEKGRIAVLCAARKSVYKRFPECDVYDIDRDSRTFQGGMPVVAHPPCRAWSAYCRHQAKPLPGEKDLAPMCVEWLRKCGGVLEHPAHSRLWDELNLPKPGESPRDGLWSASVNQVWFGDTRLKKTWVLVAHITKWDLPAIPFALHNTDGDRRRWQVMSHNQRSATCLGFAQWMVDAANRLRQKVLF